MKKQIIILGAILLATSVAAQAGHPEHYRDTAKVISAEPIYRTVEITTPERRCWDEPVERYHANQHGYTGTVLGGIIGGVVANKVSRGHGRGRDVATVAGALLGSAIGHDISNKNSGGYYTTSSERRCEVIEHTSYEEELVGYDVTYRYKGRLFTTRTDEHPGKRIPVSVDVRPVRGY
ncbi:MAG: glycine zipper 2TM domain-containing protein [Candidatus Thiodiazotropha sp.]